MMERLGWQPEETRRKYFVPLKKSPLVTGTLVQIEEKAEFFSGEGIVDSINPRSEFRSLAKE